MEKITSSRSIEVGVISGEGLSLGSWPLMKTPAFVVLKTDHDCQSAATKMAGATVDGVVSWGCEKLFLELPYHTRFLTVAVYTTGKHVGSATIPVSEFAGGYYIRENQLQLLSYRLRDGDGIKNGIINISIKVKSPVTRKTPSLGLQPEIGFPMGKRMGGECVVVGVPVMYERSPKRFRTLY